jgi:taurine dioxygenase
MKLIELEEKYPNPMHPVVRIHPVTGRRVLFVNPQFTLSINGLKEDEGQTILNFLYRQAMVPDYQLRVKWRPHTIVMWDNRSTQHYAPHDYYPHRRNMARLTVEGGVVEGPVGPYRPQEENPLKLAQAPSRDTEEKKLLRPFERQMV